MTLTVETRLQEIKARYANPKQFALMSDLRWLLELVEGLLPRLGAGAVNSPAVVPTPDVRDTLIASLLSGRAQDSSATPGESLSQIRARVDAKNSGADVTVECPACGGETYYLGNPGRREYYRCRRCGMAHIKPVRHV